MQTSPTLVGSQGFASGTVADKPRHRPPRLETVGHLLAVWGRPQPMATGTEVGCHNAMDGEKTLSMGGRFETPHPVRSSALISSAGCVARKKSATLPHKCVPARASV